MSRIGVISDIHANLHALEAVLGRLEAMEVTEIICLGDIVGYGPSPGECVDLVASRCRWFVRGNHDDGVIDSARVAEFNGNARRALLWTRTMLTEPQIAKLASMPPTAHVAGTAFCVHDTPVSGTGGYLHESKAAARAFAAFDGAICLVGHTHVPMVFEAESLLAEEAVDPSQVKVRRLTDGDVVDLDPGCRYIINPGAVGQPRDGDPRSSFGILDLANGSFTLHRESYDVDAAQEATIAAGLPSVLAERLAVGA